MAIQVWELQDSREQTGETVVFRYGIYGTTNTVDAVVAMLAEAPLSFANLVRRDADTRLRPTEVQGPDYHEGEVVYGRLESRSAGDSTFQFETGGGSQRITQSLATKKYAPTGETAPDFKGAIGVTKNSIEGVDITVPAANFSETHYLPVSSVTPTYQAAVEDLTGKVNGGTFKGRARGEVLFLGAGGSQRGQEFWEVTFKFARSKNATGLSVGPITGIDKLGWEYLWVYYDDEDDATANRIVKRPVAAYVEKVYEFADFSSLGIGT